MAYMDTWHIKHDSFQLKYDRLETKSEVPHINREREALARTWHQAVNKKKEDYQVKADLSSA